MYRTDIRPPTVVQAFTVTSTTSVGLTLPGVAGQSICLVSARRVFIGAAAGNSNQTFRIFDNGIKVFHANGTGALKFNFYNPLRIAEGNNLVVNTSVTVNTVSAAISLLYYIDVR